MATHSPVIVDELYGDLAEPLGAARWHVIHTKPNREKKLVEYLKKAGIHYYLPMFQSIRDYKYRKVTFTKPMFPGYVFVVFDNLQAAAILVTGYVVNFLKVAKTEELLSDLKRIYSTRHAKVEVFNGEWLQKGWYVEIISGPLRGMMGIVESQDKLNEVTLQVNILHQAVIAHLNPSDVKIIREYNED